MFVFEIPFIKHYCITLLHEKKQDWACICKPFKEPRNRFPAWRNPFLGSINVYKYGLCLLIFSGALYSSFHIHGLQIVVSLIWNFGPLILYHCHWFNIATVLEVTQCLSFLFKHVFFIFGQIPVNSLPTLQVNAF